MNYMVTCIGASILLMVCYRWIKRQNITPEKIRQIGGY